jgi:outer membrane protein OmpA-like peptidoglycan-associated protein
MHVRCFVVGAAALTVLACRAPPAVREPIGLTYTSAAEGPPPRRPAPAAPIAREDTKVCGYDALPAIPFERGSVLVTPEEDVVLQHLAACFTAPEMRRARIVLIGRAEREPGADCVAELGLRRSERVKQFLVGHGMPADRIDAVSAGDRESPSVIATPRVDFVVAFPKSPAQ